VAANVPELLHFAHLPRFKIDMTSLTKYTIYEVDLFYSEVPSSNTEQFLPAKIIFTFTLLPQIRQNNEDLRSLACDVLSGEQLLTF
jgi:hypothetical protein